MIDPLSDVLFDCELMYGEDPLRDAVGPLDESGFVIYGRGARGVVGPEYRNRGRGANSANPPPGLRSKISPPPDPDVTAGTADVLRGRFAHMNAAVKAHDIQVKQALKDREVDLALDKGVRPGTIGTDYVVPWNEWMSGYLKFAAANVPDMWSDDDKIGLQLSGYERELQQWIARFKSESATTVPVTTFEPTPEPPPERPGGFWGGDDGKGGVADILGELKWVAVVAVGIYVLGPALPVLAQSLRKVVSK